VFLLRRAWAYAHRHSGMVHLAAIATIGLDGSQLAATGSDGQGDVKKNVEATRRNLQRRRLVWLDISLY
jgi:hypothetical protein